MLFKKNIQYKQIRQNEETTTETESDIDTDEDNIMRDDSFAICKWIKNSLFYWWAVKISKIEDIQFEDIPSLPSHLKGKIVYNKWQKLYNERKRRNLSTSTLSMVWHSQKTSIIIATILQLIGWSLYLLAFLVFKNNLWPIMAKDHIDILIVVQFSLIIFLIFSVKSILTTHSMYRLVSICSQTQSSVYISVYYKTLSLNLTECDKQQVMSVIGTDIYDIYTALFTFLNYTPAIILIPASALAAICMLVGRSAVFGIIFMVCIGIPLQLYVAFQLVHYGNLRMLSADKRIQLITELIRGVRVLKVSCYELPLMRRVDEYRKDELNHVSKRNIYLSLIMLVNFMIPAIMLFIILMVYCFGYKYIITSNITLFILMLFTMIQLVVRIVPMIIGYFVSFVVSCRRIDSFYERKSINIMTNHCKDNNIAIGIENASFIWIDVVLNNITMRIKRGTLVAIVGKVGAGKSSLLESILGEMKCIDGEINVNLDEIVYCSQTPYIRNTTLRQNIVLELPFVELKYKQCIAAAALQYDLDKLPNSDMTLIGEEGVNISGGQKMRVAFARALYRKSMKNNNQIYLFDDPLSSVDIYVGKHMFFNGIYKYIMNHDTTIATCIMVINSHLHLLKYFDEIIIMDEGQIKAQSTVYELFQNQANNGLYQEYQHLLPNIDQIIDKIDDEEEDCKNEEELNDLHFSIHQNHEPLEQYCNDEKQTPDWNLLLTFIKASLTTFDPETHWFNDTEKIQQYENAQNDTVKLISLLILFIITFLILCAQPLSDLWILHWNQHISDNQTLWYLSVWFTILCFIAFGTISSMYLLCKVSLKSAHHIHSKSLYNILRANTLFYDITARGDIMNRFTKETNVMDIEFVTRVYQCILCLSSITGYFILIMTFIPLSSIPILIISPMLLYVKNRYENAYFSCLGIEKKKQSAILTLFTESVCNLDSIRAYKLQSFFMDDMIGRIDQLTQVIYIEASLTASLHFYEEMLLNILQSIVIIVSVFQMQINNNNNNINSQFIILSCWYFTSIASNIGPAILTYVFAKQHFTSIMSLIYYHHVFEENHKIGKEIIYEAQQMNHDYRITELWPRIGNININKLQLRYRKKLKIVLDINKKIEIKHGAKIGICGRTGSGKSSILVSIFRLFQPLTNDVVIDALRIDKLGLYDLRSNLSIISQHPVLFNGNLRFNLDPFNEYTDDEIWIALKDVKLFDLIQRREGKLLCTVEENGSNFSVGQRQLLCFARSILKKSKILFMDEATSSIDKNTDNIIQTLIRSERFTNVTVICIAHRLQSIIDYDFILLLANGHILQYDTPQNLLSDKNGHFSKMVETDKLYLTE